MKMPRRKQSGTGRYQDDSTIPDNSSYSDDPASWDHDGSGGSTVADEELTYSGDDADDEMYDEIGEADSFEDDDLGGSAPPRR
jgi:hypothetical protein